MITITKEFIDAMVEVVKNLPVEVQGQEIQLLTAGSLLVSYIYGGKIYIKKVPCNNCGLCCVDRPGTIHGDDDEGNCKALFFNDGKWLCRVWNERTVNCLGDPLKIRVEECSIEYYEVEVK